MKNLLLILIVFTFMQCQIPSSPPPTQPISSLSNVCDSVSSGKYMYSANSEFKILGTCKVDYTSTVIDSSDNDSVFVYADIKCKIDMNYNRTLWLQAGSMNRLDTPTHVCLSGGICQMIDVMNSHTYCMSFPGNSVMALKWSSVSGVLESSNSINALIVKNAKVIGSYKHPAMLPNYDLYHYVNTNMYNRDWWVNTINTKTGRCYGGTFWNYL